MHFIRLLAVWWPVTDFKNLFTDKLSNKHFLIWLLTTPPLVEHVATLPSNLSLIALTLMFHKVVWILNNRFTADLPRNLPLICGLTFWPTLYNLVTA